jgi:hypothetical protein
MNTYRISANNNEEIGQKVVDLDAKAVLAFLEEVDAYLYSVSEWDDEDECVERLNGDEWLEQKTRMERVMA